MQSQVHVQLCLTSAADLPDLRKSAGEIPGAGSPDFLWMEAALKVHSAKLRLPMEARTRGSMGDNPPWQAW
jgi:hypothetical protein